MAKDRMLRVGELIKREVSAILMKDLVIPGLGFVTITKVSVTRDLQNAKIYVSIYGDQAAQQNAMRKLADHRGEIHQILRPRLTMRYVPNLTFVHDDSAEYSDYISRRLMEIRRQDEERHRKNK